ncbi:undecaprenyl-diphosphate phosphatase [Natranaerofaba carboxydovora]|uniref:undecaprenyl-diphosphate phosphatase n=1 Tax=Natranaerofaba carboxydovora TaxID=2742683 RepID=UPI001F147DE9|nr:undecaprenyl-diphosphate phosphatase [Natranaerofaba carboxydovora]UMZ72596.1 Undecaprenyl-diphosphatase [Natranaerofaba carboxydovora]
MNYIEAIILGIIQGISEFLPVSSTAHLIIAENVLGITFPGLVFEVFLHFSSVLAVIIYFAKDLVKLIKGFISYTFLGNKNYIFEFKLGLYLVLSTVATGVLGILLEGILDEHLRGTVLISLGLFVSGILLCLVERHQNFSIKKGKNQKHIDEIGWIDSVIIGIWQGFAVIPGISRSGATVVGALWRSLEKESALFYSFFLSVPVIVSSSIIKLPDIDGALLSNYPGEMFISFVTSFVCALLGIKFLIYLVKQSKLTHFSVYLFILSSLTLIFI